MDVIVSFFGMLLWFILFWVIEGYQLLTKSKIQIDKKKTMCAGTFVWRFSFSVFLPVLHFLCLIVFSVLTLAGSVYSIVIYNSLSLCYEGRQNSQIFSYAVSKKMSINFYKYCNMKVWLKRWRISGIVPMIRRREPHANEWFALLVQACLS